MTDDRVLYGRRSRRPGYIRAAVALALGQIGPAARAAIPALTQALDDADEGVRRCATKALKQFDATAEGR